VIHRARDGDGRQTASGVVVTLREHIVVKTTGRVIPDAADAGVTALTPRAPVTAILLPGTVVAVERASADPMLVARLCDGDANALGTVYDRYAALVHGVARRVLGDEAGAEDVTQDVFTHLWRHPDRVDLERGCLRSYLGVIAHRRAVDSLRRRARRGRREERTAHAKASEPSVEDAVVVSVVSSWRSARVLDALERLPDDQQAAVRLAFYGGRTYRQVATELGIPEGSAKSRLRLALTRLRSELEQPGAESWR
jgi:RNA polymerase sigma-70 factor (ECF subfamily)